MNDQTKSMRVLQGIQEGESTTFVENATGSQERMVRWRIWKKGRINEIRPLEYFTDGIISPEYDCGATKLIGHYGN
jgi:hypothetical protein